MRTIQSRWKYAGYAVGATWPNITASGNQTGHAGNMRDTPVRLAAGVISCRLRRVAATVLLAVLLTCALGAKRGYCMVAKLC